MKKKKHYNYFWYPFYAILIIYIALSIALNSGYYESRINDKITLTEEQIEKFEQDVKEGKAVDVSDYISDNFVDYSNSVSKLGQSISNNVEELMTNGIGKMFNLIGSLIS